MRGILIVLAASVLLASSLLSGSLVRCVHADGAQFIELAWATCCSDEACESASHDSPVPELKHCHGCQDLPEVTHPSVTPLGYSVLAHAQPEPIASFAMRTLHPNCTPGVIHLERSNTGPPSLYLLAQLDTTVIRC